MQKPFAVYLQREMENGKEVKVFKPLLHNLGWRGTGVELVLSNLTLPQAITSAKIYAKNAGGRFREC